MRELLLCFMLSTAAGLAAGYSGSYSGLSTRDLARTSSIIEARGLGSSQLLVYRLLEGKQLVGRGVKGVASPSTPSTKTPANNPPTRILSFAPSSGGTPPRAPSPGNRMLSSSSSSSSSSNAQKSGLTQELKSAGYQSSALTAALKSQQVATDNAFAKVSDPKMMMAALSHYRPTLGARPQRPHVELSPKNAAAQHSAAADRAANLAVGVTDPSKRFRGAAFAESHALSSIQAAQRAHGPEVGSAEKHAIVAYQHAERARGSLLVPLPFNTPQPAG